MVACVPYKLGRSGAEYLPLYQKTIAPASSSSGTAAGGNDNDNAKPVAEVSSQSARSTGASVSSEATAIKCVAGTATFYSEPNAVGEKRTCKFTWGDTAPGKFVELYIDAGNGVIRRVCAADGEWKDVKAVCTRLPVVGN